MGTLEGKRAFITGTSQGIGAAIAERLINAGCHCALHYFSDGSGPQAQTQTQKASALGQEAFSLRADLTDTGAATSCVKQAVESLGGLDILINNAGSLVGRRTLEELDDGFFENVMALNMRSVLAVTRAALPALKAAKQASIVNMSSLAGRKGGHPGSLAYSTAKGAMLAWTRSLATELGPQGIRVNSVSPGLILGTSFHARHTTKESAEQTVTGLPLDRAGTPEDVARAVAYLASEYDGFITGATLDINGGAYAA